MAAKKPLPPNPNTAETLTLPNGKVLACGDEFTVKGVTNSGRYSFRYGWFGNQATCWGPVGSKSPSMRTFHVNNITTLHRKKNPS